jgi:hypothetical protein
MKQKKTKMLKSFNEFINEEYYEEVEGSAFTDIKYYTQSGPTFGTEDQFTIDFIHTISAYFENNDELFRERLHKFNMYHKLSLDYDKMMVALPKLEQEWFGEPDLSPELLTNLVENPDSIADIIGNYMKSKSGIDKYDL